MPLPAIASCEGGRRGQDARNSGGLRSWKSQGNRFLPKEHGPTSIAISDECD